MAEDETRDRFIIIEDDILIALELRSIVEGLGGTVVGTASALVRAKQLVCNVAAEAALLDVNLGGTQSFAIATMLRDRQIEFAFVTGCEMSDLPSEFAQTPVLNKPFTRSEAQRIVMTIWRRGVNVALV